MKKQLVGIIGAGFLAGSAMANCDSHADSSASAGGISGGGFLGGISGSVSMGYDTDYYFRGVNLGGSPIWSGVDLSIPLGEGLTLNPGVWYINPTNGGVDNDELDYYVGLGWEAGDVGVNLLYTAYTYPEAGGDTHEFGIGLSYAIGMIELGVGYYYDIDLETSYYEVSAGTSFDIADGIALSLGATLGFLEEDTNHLLLVASLPIALTENATLEPYIAGNFALDAIEDGDDDVFGGVSISVAF